MLLVESVAFAPFVFAGAVLVDIYIAGVQRSIYVIVASELLLAGVYVNLALIVRKKIKSRLSQLTLADVGGLLIIIPIGAMFSSLTYSTVLYISEAFPLHDLFIVIYRFMLGDILGIITIIPAIILIFMTLSILTVLTTIYREESAKGATYYVTMKILAASRIVLCPDAMFKLNCLEFSYKEYNPNHRRDQLYFLTHKYYLSKKFTWRQRVRAAMDHQEYEIQNYDFEYARCVYRSGGLLLWQWSVDGLRFTIVLVATEDNRHEGDLSVILYVNNTRLCRMSFCYINPDIFGLSSDMTMLISRNQTDRTPARALFDRCFRQNTPQFFCLAAVCGIAVSNEFKALLAIKHDFANSLRRNL